jgi:hypothetical protein
MDNVTVSARLSAIEKRLDEIIKRLDEMKNLLAMFDRARPNDRNAIED